MRYSLVDQEEDGKLGKIRVSIYCEAVPPYVQSMSDDRRSWKYLVGRSALALLAGLVVIIATRLILAAYFPDISLIWTHLSQVMASWP